MMVIPDDLLGVFEDMLQHIFTTREVSPEGMALAKGYLNASQQDLRASKVMYKQRMYAQSTYHLQQCAEKATKAYLLGIGMGTVDEVRRIGHDSLKGHLLYARKLSKFFPELRRIDPMLNIDLSEIEKLEAKRIEIARWSRAKVKGELRVFEKVDKTLSSMIPQMVGLTIEVIAPQLEEGQQLKLEAIGEDRIVKVAMPLLRAPQFLFIASLLTFPHEAYTRYPDSAIKPEDYTKSMGIVSNTPELIRGMEKALLAMRKLWM
jgi:HEPN domain-containing protein